VHFCRGEFCVNFCQGGEFVDSCENESRIRRDCGRSRSYGKFFLFGLQFGSFLLQSNLDIMRFNIVRTLI
jgi:hypothetical protein